MTQYIQPPKARRILKTLKAHDDERQDDYFWLNDRENKDVIEYLNAENQYYESVTSKYKNFENSLFEEMKSRIKEDDMSVPYKFNGYWYIVKFEVGKDYPLYFRKKDSLDNPEELLFDCNEMAKGHDYFNMVGLSVSPDNTMISFGLDTVGRRNYTLQIKSLVTQELLTDVIPNTTGSATWANDNKTLFYTVKDEKTLRSDKVFKHTLGTVSNNDTLIFTEKDDTFGVAVYKSKSRKYLIIACYSTMTNEFHILNANTPDGEFSVFQERRRGLEYSVSHYDDQFYIVTNADGAYNFKLMKTPEAHTEFNFWEEVIPHRENVLLEDIDIFKNFLVISERSNGLNRIRIKRWEGSEDYYIPYDNETYTAYTSTNVDFDTNILRYGYNAMTTPASSIDFNMVTKEKTILKQQEVLDPGFDPNNYASERVWATADDGTKVPISMVYKKAIKKNGSNPVLLYAYGSYGHTIDPYFSSIRLSLLDRGFIYAIAHVRGGEYMGRMWYEKGRLLQKKNTFTDFIACSKFLIAEQFTSSDHLYALGGSAGGLLIGAVINEAPELYKGVIAAVPFVDVLTTMLDDSIPLTTGEYDEWGNPNEKMFYEYIKSYSPYDNVKKQKYPHILITTGLHDSQVQYWEPAKWVAKLRTYKTDTNQLLFKTNMKAGHGGASGRYEALREDAEEYAFLLDLENIHT